MNKVGHPFYGSGKWKRVRAEYLKTVHGICEKCGKPATQVHHKDPLTDEDYYVNYSKCYGFENLQALCLSCHNRMDGHFLSSKKKQAIADGYSVDMITGDIIPPMSHLECVNGKPLGKGYEKLRENK